MTRKIKKGAVHGLKAVGGSFMSINLMCTIKKIKSVYYRRALKRSGDYVTDIFSTIHIKRGGYIFFRKSWFWSMKTVFPEKKCMGVFCRVEKSDVCKNGTG